ncbi:MAG: hypothetical protein LBC97_10035 [Bifidobacteriaceae bacterium]|nr:hypothetical protein [Bifidobacteriaceae bacterium]
MNVVPPCAIAGGAGCVDEALATTGSLVFEWWMWSVAAVLIGLGLVALSRLASRPRIDLEA